MPEEILGGKSAPKTMLSWSNQVAMHLQGIMQAASKVLHQHENRRQTHQ